jgi:hypothetical protein
MKMVRRTRLCIICSLALLATAAGGEVVEVGADDARVSFMGGSGNIESEAGYAAVAFDAPRARFLVVWDGHEDRSPAPIETGLYAQFLDAASGVPVGERRRVATHPTFSPPALLYNGAQDEYYLVYDGIGAGVDILAQRLAAGSGEAIGDPRRLQAAGTSGLAPAVAWNPVENQYLVAWGSDVAAGGGEVLVQRVDAVTGLEVGTDDQRVTDIGPPGEDTYFAGLPRLAYNEVEHEFLVTFLATPPEGPGQISDHFEIFGQRLSAVTGAEVGADDFRISAMGPPDDSGSSAGYHDLAFDPAGRQYLAVWEGNGSQPGMGQFETEIFSQRLDGATGAEIGSDDLRLTAVGGLGDPNQTARRPRLVHDPRRSLFLLVSLAHLRIDEAQLDGEILVHEIDAASGLPLAPIETLISQSGGPAGSDGAALRAFTAATAVASTSGEILVVWHGEDDDGGMVAGEREVFAQRLLAGVLFRDGFESGGSGFWN